MYLRDWGVHESLSAVRYFKQTLLYPGSTNDAECNGKERAESLYLLKQCGLPLAQECKKLAKKYQIELMRAQEYLEILGNE